MKDCINITRINNFEYSFKLSTKMAIRYVAKALTFKNPDPFAYSDKIEKFDKRRLTFKIGMLSVVKEYAEDRDIEINIHDYHYTAPDLDIDNRMSGKYDYQRKAVETFYKHRFGIIAVPTRGGKTFIAAEIFRLYISSSLGNVLFLTDNTTLFLQAINDIQNYFEPYGGIEIGEIKAGKIDTTHRITIGMIQTVQSTLSDRCHDRNKKKDLENYLKNLEFLCVDEIHDNCSDSKLKIYKKAINIEYLLLLSATPYRAGAFTQNLKLKEWSGDIIYQITEKELRDVGVLSYYRVFMLHVNHNLYKYEPVSEDYIGYRDALIFNNEIRNNMLLRVIDVLKDLNLKTLLLFSSVKHGKYISEVTGLPFISGEDDNVERSLELKKFLQGEGNFLLASKILNKGVTISSCQVLINVDGGLEDANTIQKKGRILGTTKNKDRSAVIDFFDFCEEYFSEHSETRLNIYVNSVGEKNIRIIDMSNAQCYDYLRKSLSKWFKKE